MQSSTSDFHSLAARVERLEKQNRRMRRLCVMLVLTPALVIVACQSRPALTVEAQKFVLRDKNGKVRAEIAMNYDIGPKGYPVVRLLDEGGKERTTIGAGVLNISGEDGTRAVFLDDTLQLTNKSGGVTARLSGGDVGGGSLSLFGQETGGSIVLNADMPDVELVDAKGFRSNLGSSELVTPHTGARTSTSAASLVLSGKDDKILWRTPK